MKSNFYIGIDIGGTKSAVTLGKQSDVDNNIEIIDRIECETQKGSEVYLGIDNILNMVSDILEKNSISENYIMAAGISCGGPLDSKNGIILSPPNLVGWDNIPIVDIITDKYNFPCYLQNDANACALAEWKFGAGKGYRNIVFLTFGTGLGAGLILNGMLYSGTNDMAGEIGHMRLEPHGPVGYGKEGSFEGFCSGGGIAQIGRAKVLEHIQMGEYPEFCKTFDMVNNLTAKEIAKAAENGNLLAKEIYNISAYHLGMGLSVIIDFLNPEIIIIGSIYSRSNDLFKDIMTSKIEQEALKISCNNCKIEPSKLGDSIGDYAAISVAVNGVSQIIGGKNE